nr:DDT domain-containing protein PTM [Ipomoea batatas]
MKSRKKVYPGLLLSQKPNDERVALFRRNLLVLSGELDATIDSPKCSLCSELESTPTMNYIACELCGGEAKLAELKSDDGIECAGFHLVQAHIHQEGKQ